MMQEIKQTLQITFGSRQEAFKYFEQENNGKVVFGF